MDSRSCIGGRARGRYDAPAGALLATRSSPSCASRLGTRAGSRRAKPELNFLDLAFGREVRECLREEHTQTNFPDSIRTAIITTLETLSQIISKARRSVRGAYAFPRAVFGVSPNRVFRRDAPAASGRGRVGAPRTLRRCEILKTFDENRASCSDFGA